MEILLTKVFWNIESKYALPNDVIFKSGTRPVFVRRYSSLKSKLIFLGQKTDFQIFRMDTFCQVGKKH